MMSWAHDGASVASAVFGTWLSGLVGPASASSGGGGTDEPRTMPNGPHQGEASLLLAHATEGALSVAMVPPRGGGQGHQARQGRRARGRGSRSVAEPCSAAAMVPQVASSDSAAAWSSGGVRGGPARRARASSLAVDSQPRADDAARAALDDRETSSSGEPTRFTGQQACASRLRYCASSSPSSGLFIVGRPGNVPSGAKAGDPEFPQDDPRIDSGAPDPGGLVAASSVGTLPNRIFVPSAWRQTMIFVPSAGHLVPLSEPLARDQTGRLAAYSCVFKYGLNM